MKSHDGNSVPGAKPETQFATTCKVATGKDLGTGILVTKCNPASYSSVSRLSACVLMCAWFMSLVLHLLVAFLRPINPNAPAMSDVQVITS